MNNVINGTQKDTNTNRSTCDMVRGICGCCIWASCHISEVLVNKHFYILLKEKGHKKILFHTPLGKVGNHHHSNGACMHGVHNPSPADIFSRRPNLDSKEPRLGQGLIVQFQLLYTCILGLSQIFYRLFGIESTCSRIISNWLYSEMFW